MESFYAGPLTLGHVKAYPALPNINYCSASFSEGQYSTRITTISIIAVAVPVIIIFTINYWAQSRYELAGPNRTNALQRRLQMSDRREAHPMRAGLYKMRGVLACIVMHLFFLLLIYLNVSFSSVFRAMHGGKICT